MRQAKPTEADSEAVLRLLQGIESIIETGSHPDSGDAIDSDSEAIAWIDKQWERAGLAWQRVYWAGVTAIDNACDPDLTYLEFKPELREQAARIAAIEAENAALRDELARLREELAKSRLVWSDESPTEEGWYQYRPRAGTVYWRGHAVYFVVRRKGVLEAQDCPVCQVPGQWAGPIPEPQEPSE